ncbi:YfiR family protein [Hugenholtzia roseola]|uniref:YfiR family protein n=1 Tax=Hugenholtzia roseola TaxID=1002 RepID=UPI0013781CF4|nr:YfiR family protein [Hugenholtzia roseola]
MKIATFRFQTLRLFFLLFFFWFFASVQNSQAQYNKYELRAGLILNFVKYTLFPAEAFSGTNDRIKIGILGDDPFGGTIERVLIGRPVQGRHWRIVRGKKAKEVWNCHVVFICQSEKNNIKEILEYLGQYPTITIGDQIPNFCQYGGIINFIDGKYNFEINSNAAKSVKLILDARLLNMARNIIGDTTKP